MQPGDRVSIRIPTGDGVFKLSIALDKDGEVSASTQRESEPSRKSSDVYDLDSDFSRQTGSQEVVEEAAEEDIDYFAPSAPEHPPMAVPTLMPVGSPGGPPVGSGRDVVPEQTIFSTQPRVPQPPQGQTASIPDGWGGVPDSGAYQMGGNETMYSPPPAAVPVENPTLPAWTGHARDYRDPETELRKKETRKLHKERAKEAIQHSAGGGLYSVFLSRPSTDEKRNEAAEIIAHLQGISLADARLLAGKMVIPVAKDISEEDAKEIRKVFKESGLACRLTQKR